jgi:hypothetical protein
MTSVHKNPTPATSPLLSCCAAHININETVSPLDDMNVDGVGDQASSGTKNFKPDVGKEALQSPVTTQKKRTQKSEENQLDKEVVAIYQKACEKSIPAEKSKPDSTSKPVQGSDSSSKKPAGNATTKKLALQDPSRCELTSYRRNKKNALRRSASLESLLNSDTDEPTPRKAVFISATKNSVPKSPAKSNRKTASKGVTQRNLSKKNRKEWVIADFGCITVGTTGHRGYSTISLTGFSDKMARKLGNEIAQYAGTRGVRKERAWGYGYEFQLRGDPWGGRKSEYKSKLSAEYLDRVVGDGATDKEQTFMLHLLEVMRRNGYTLHLANQALLHGNFYFKKAPTLAKGTTETMTISFHEPNRLRLTCAPDEFLDSVEDLLSQHPRFKGECKKTQDITNGVPKSAEYKVPEASWQPWHFFAQMFPEKRMRVSRARAIKLELMNLLEEHGWKLIMSSDKSISSNNNRAAHFGSTWYYYRDRDTIKAKGLEVEGI